jgi:long-chain fatty acid transport protein
MKRALPLLLVLVMTLPVYAQSTSSVRITSSPNPIGSGARATAMGGAFIGIADDSTASSWNPAGLVQLEWPEFSIVGEGFWRLEDMSASLHPESHSDDEFDLAALNFINAAYPFHALGRNWVVSINYQRLYSFERELSFDFNTSGALFTQDGEYQFKQEGSLYALSPAIAVRLGERLSLGATLNIWRDPPGRDYAWRASTRYRGSGEVEGDPFDAAMVQKDVYKDFRAENFNLGLRYEVNSKLVLGAVFKSPFTARLHHRQSFLRSVDFGEGASDSLEEFSRDEELDFPWVLGVGACMQWNKNLKTALDITRTEWDDFVLDDRQGNRTSFVTGERERDEDIDPVYTARLGCEYLVFKESAIIPLRCGVFYDPEPSSNHPDDYAGLSFGSGYVSEGFSLDFSYTWRFGRNVGGDVVDIPGARMDVDQHQFLISLIKYF